MPQIVVPALEDCSDIPGRDYKGLVMKGRRIIMNG